MGTSTTSLPKKRVILVHTALHHLVPKLTTVTIANEYQSSNRNLNSYVKRLFPLSLLSTTINLIPINIKTGFIYPVIDSIQRTRKQLRHLLKLRNTKYESATQSISDAYKRMHLRKANIHRQYGQTQLAIINWRILFEEQYLSEIKCLLQHFEHLDREKRMEDTVYSEASSAPAAFEDDPSPNLQIPDLNFNDLPEEAPSSGELDASLLSPETEDVFPSMTSHAAALEEEEKMMSIDGIHGMEDDIKMDNFGGNLFSKSLRKESRHSSTRFDDSLSQRIIDQQNNVNQSIDSIHCPKSQIQSQSQSIADHQSHHHHFTTFDSNRYPPTLDVSGYLHKYRSDLEMATNEEQKQLSSICKSLRQSLKKEESLLQREEGLISYQERLGVVIVLFHYFIETNRYDLKSNVYARNDIASQLSSKKVKQYYLSHNVVTQIQHKFDSLVLDSRNEIGKQIRKWLKLVATKDVRHLKPAVLLKHINSFIRDFIRSYHYIINDIVRDQYHKYDIEFVLQQHRSPDEVAFSSFIRSQYFCRKRGKSTMHRRNRNHHHSKATTQRHSTIHSHSKRPLLTAVALRWTLLRLLQRCIYSRIAVIGVFPPIHSLRNETTGHNQQSQHCPHGQHSQNANIPRRTLKDTRDRNLNRNQNTNNNHIDPLHGMSLHSSLMKESQPISQSVMMTASRYALIDDDEEGDFESIIGIDSNHLLSPQSIKRRPRSKSEKPMAMQMVTLPHGLDLDGIESMESIESMVDLNNAINVDEQKERSPFNHFEEKDEEELRSPSNVEYFSFNKNKDPKSPEFDHETTVIQYRCVSPNSIMDSKQQNKPKTQHQSLKEPLPEFSIYGLPRNSDYEFMLLDQHFFNQCAWMRNLSPTQLGIEEIFWCDTPPQHLRANSDILINVRRASMESECSDNDNDHHDIDGMDDTLYSISNSLPIGSTSHRKGSLPLHNCDASTLSNSKSMMVLRKSFTAQVTSKRTLDHDFGYDYSVKPFGDALALIECLDELTTPLDMNECLGFVVDVIFRTAQTYRKFNIHRQTKLERYQLDLSTLIYNKKEDAITTMNKKETTREKLGSRIKGMGGKLLESLKAETLETHHESQSSLSQLNGEAAIGADVFFPLFVWVIVHSRIRNIHRSVFVMSHYNDSDAMKTKVGYNVSTLHSALDHIMKADKKMYIKQQQRQRR